MLTHNRVNSGRPLERWESRACVRHNAKSSCAILTVVMFRIEIITRPLALDGMCKSFGMHVSCSVDAHVYGNDL